MSLRFAALQPTAVWSRSDRPLTQSLSLIPLRGTRERTGLLSAAPNGAAASRGMSRCGFRLQFWHNSAKQNRCWRAA